jgi:hypothetical protein
VSAYPVHYRIDHPAHFTRFQLAARVLAFVVLGMLGLSFGTVFACAFVGLPLFAAYRLGGGRTVDAYTRTDGPRVVAALRWLAAISAWAGLIAEELPTTAPQETVRLDVELASHATPSTAMWRVITGLPSAIVLGFLCAIGMLVWWRAAASILVTRRVGPHAFGYLAGLQRWTIRLLAYQASLVDAYPPFSFSDDAAPPIALAAT